MSTKVANLISAQLGILIGLMSWLVYAQLHPVRSEPAAAVQEDASAPFNAAARAFEREDEDLRPEPRTYRNPGDRLQPNYAPQAQPVQYYQQPYQQPVQEPVAPATVDYNSGYYAANSPTYSEPAYSESVQEPAAVPADYYYVPQYYPYYAIANQVVVTNDSHRRRNRCEPPTRGNFPPGQVHQQPPDRGHHGICPGPAPIAPGTVPLPPVKAPVAPAPQSQGVRPPRNIAPPVNPVQPRRVVFPAQPRTVRPNAAAP